MTRRREIKEEDGKNSKMKIGRKEGLRRRDRRKRERI